MSSANHIALLSRSLWTLLGRLAGGSPLGADVDGEDGMLMWPREVLSDCWVRQHVPPIEVERRLACRTMLNCTFLLPFNIYELVIRRVTLRWWEAVGKGGSWRLRPGKHHSPWRLREASSFAALAPFLSFSPALSAPALSPRTPTCQAHAHSIICRRDVYCRTRLSFRCITFGLALDPRLLEPCI